MSTSPARVRFRLTPHDRHVLRTILAQTQLRHDSDTIRVAIKTAHEAVVRSKAGRVVMRHEERRLQEGVWVGAGRIGAEETPQAKATQIFEVGLAGEPLRQLTGLVDADFAVHRTGAIRRALTLYLEVVQKAREGWSFGWLDSAGSFHPILTEGLNAPPAAPALADEVEATPAAEIVSRAVLDLADDFARLAKMRRCDPGDLARDLLRAGLDRFASPNRTEKLQAEKGDDEAVLATFVAEEEFENLVIAAEQPGLLAPWLAVPLVSQMARNTTVFFLHHDEGAYQTFRKGLFESAAGSGQEFEDQTRFIAAPKRFISRNHDLLVFDYDKPLWRCGAHLHAPLWTPFTADQLESFYVQHAALLRSKEAHPPRLEAAPNASPSYSRNKE